MGLSRRLLGAAGTAAVLTGTLAAPASADDASRYVHIAKDQGGGAYYNVVTGERFDVTAASALPTLGAFGIRVTNSLILTNTGQLLMPVGTGTDGTPAASVVEVAESSAFGTYQSVSDGALFAVESAGQALPAGNEFAVELATGAILTINDEVLLPVQHLLGLDRY